MNVIPSTLSTVEAYELAMALAAATSKASWAGWRAFRDGYGESARQLWELADECSWVRWDVLTQWYASKGPGELLMDEMRNKDESKPVPMPHMSPSLDRSRT